MPDWRGPRKRSASSADAERNGLPGDRGIVESAIRLSPVRALSYSAASSPDAAEVFANYEGDSLRGVARCSGDRVDGEQPGHCEAFRNSDIQILVEKDFQLRSASPIGLLHRTRISPSPDPLVMLSPQNSGCFANVIGRRIDISASAQSRPFSILAFVRKPSSSICTP